MTLVMFFWLAGCLVRLASWVDDQWAARRPETGRTK